MTIEPVPFKTSLPGRDTLGFDGFRSISYRVDGLVHFDGEIVTFEWTTTRHSEDVLFGGVEERDDVSGPELLDLPVSWIGAAALERAWWRPRLMLRGRRLDAFDGIPGAKPGRILLPILRRDRAIAAAMASAMEEAGRMWMLGAGESTDAWHAEAENGD